MERLTQKLDKMIWFKDQGLKIEPCEMNAHHCRMILEKLADYEDLEEQGLFVRLPFKLNHKLYHFYEIDIEDDFADAAPDEIIMEVVATEFIIDRHEITIKCITGWNSSYEYLPAAEIGKTVFLTHEEAEKKLEEMKNDSFS